MLRFYIKNKRNMMQLVNKEIKKTVKSVSFKIEEDLINEFRALSKELKVNQSAVIRTAIKTAINEMKSLKKGKHDEQ